MNSIKRIVAVISLSSFLINAALSDLAFGLATPSQLTDIVGIQHKDMGRIEFALAEELVRIDRLGLPRDKATFQAILNGKHFLERTIFQPADMQFFWHEPKGAIGESLCYMVRLKDEYGLRTYYATFSMHKDENGGFPINVYTEEQYKGTDGFTKGLPQIKEEDAKAVDRYVQHEKGIDAVIRYAYQHDLLGEPLKNKFDYKDWAGEILRMLNVNVSNPEKLVSIEDRKCMLIKVTPELMNVMKNLPKARVVGPNGEEYEIGYTAHASNNAVYIFVSETYFYMLTNPNANIPPEQFRRKGGLVTLWLVHELGVMLGLAPLRFERRYGADKYQVYPINELDDRINELAKNPHQKLSVLNLTIANLDNVKTRDYAAGQAHKYAAQDTAEIVRVMDRIIAAVTREDLKTLAYAQYSSGSIAPETAAMLNRIFISAGVVIPDDRLSGAISDSASLIRAKAIEALDRLEQKYAAQDTAEIVRVMDRIIAAVTREDLKTLAYAQYSSGSIAPETAAMLNRIFISAGVVIPDDRLSGAISDSASLIRAKAIEALDRLEQKYAAQDTAEIVRVMDRIIAAVTREDLKTLAYAQYSSGSIAPETAAMLNRIFISAGVVIPDDRLSGAISDSASLIRAKAIEALDRLEQKYAAQDTAEIVRVMDRIIAAVTREDLKTLAYAQYSSGSIAPETAAMLNRIFISAGVVIPDDRLSGAISDSASLIRAKAIEALDRLEQKYAAQDTAEIVRVMDRIIAAVTREDLKTLAYAQYSSGSIAPETAAMLNRIFISAGVVIPDDRLSGAISDSASLIRAKAIEALDRLEQKYAAQDTAEIVRVMDRIIAAVTREDLKTLAYAQYSSGSIAPETAAMLNRIFISAGVVIPDDRLSGAISDSADLIRAKAIEALDRLEHKYAAQDTAEIARVMDRIIAAVTREDLKTLAYAQYSSGSIAPETAAMLNRIFKTAGVVIPDDRLSGAISDSADLIRAKAIEALGRLEHKYAAQDTAERPSAAQSAAAGESSQQTALMSVSNLPLRVKVSKIYVHAPGQVMTTVTFVRTDAIGPYTSTYIRRPVNEEPIITAQLVVEELENVHIHPADFETAYYRLAVPTSLLSVQGDEDYRPRLAQSLSQPAVDVTPALAAPMPIEEIAAMTSLVSDSVLELRKQIPTHPSERYILLVTSEFLAKGELEEHRAKYGDRFDLDKISGASPEQIVDNILAKAGDKPARTIALVPDDLQAGQLERLTKAGIRFVRVNVAELRKAKEENDADRAAFQVDTYTIMLLLRRVDNSITADSSIYKLLSFYLKSHFALTDKIAVGEYIRAIVGNDITKLIKGCLAYRPAQAYKAPDYNNVAASLISA